MMNKILGSLLAAVLIASAIAVVTAPLTAFAAEVNPAHDANEGGGNEKSLGTCKQEMRNDDACVAQK
jgi:hypothetical protein